MQNAYDTLASRPSLWAPRVPLFFETPDVTQTAAPATTPPETSPAAPEAAPVTTPPDGTSATPESTSFETPFRLEDVPEAVREHVQRYNAQLQGAFTRKTQELAEQRKQLDPLRRFEGLLSDDESTRDSAVRAVLEHAGWDYDDDLTPEENLEGAAAAAAEATTAQSSLPPAEAARIAALEAAEEAREKQAYLTGFNERLNGGLDEYKQTLGFKAEDTVPEHIRRGVVAYLQQLGPDEDGWPQVQTAIDLFEADRAAEQQRYFASKDIPTPDLTGVAASERTYDVRDPKQRLEMANAVAARHV